MAVLATPKKNSYVLKKDSAKKIVESTTKGTDIAALEENAKLFLQNNLKSKDQKSSV